MELLDAHFVQEALMIMAAAFALLAVAITLVVRARGGGGPDGRWMLALHRQAQLALASAESLPPDRRWQRSLPARAPPSTHRLSPPQLRVSTRE